MLKKIYLYIILIYIINTFIFPVNAQNLNNFTLKINSINVKNLPQISAYISVYDQNNKNVAGLTKSNFEIWQDKTKISNFSLESTLKEGITLSIMLLIDTSGSMDGEPLQKAKEGAIKYISLSGVNEKIGVMIFSDEIKLIADFSNNKNYLIDSIKSINRLGNSTLLYNAIYRGINELMVQRSDQKIMIILTDGKDEGSTNTFKECINLAKENNIKIYTIGLGENCEETPLKNLALTTKAKYYYIQDLSKIISVYQNILQELHNEYILTFRSPTGKDKKFHELTVYLKYNNVNISNKKQFLSDIISLPVISSLSNNSKIFNYSNSYFNYSTLYFITLVSIGLGIGVIITLIYFILTNKKKLR